MAVTLEHGNDQHWRENALNRIRWRVRGAFF